MGWQTTLATIFEGTDFVFNSSGEFFYQGLPTAGNLIASNTNSPGLDAFNNRFLAGFTEYDNVHGQAVNINEGILSFYTFTGFPAVFTQTLQLEQFFTGPNTYLNLFQGNGIALNSLALIGTNAQGNLTVTNAASQTGSVPVVQTDVSTHTNGNLVGDQPLTVAWTIDANDGIQGTLYEIDVPFNGTFENQSLGFVPMLNGVAVATSGGDTIGGGFFPLGTAFVGTVKLSVLIESTGALGSARMYIDGGLGISANRSSGTNNNNAFLSSQNTAVAFDTLVSNTIQIATIWGGSTAGQTVGSNWSKFTRSGP